MVKKVLIITYYWPPSGGGGVQRWLKFAKYLRDFGWEPVICTPRSPDFEIRDESLQGDVPKDIEVIKRPIWEPYSIYRKLLGKKAVQKQGVVNEESGSWLSKFSIWLRGNYFIPDSRVFWVRPTVNFLSRRLKKKDIDIIITTGPPHSIHLIGLELKKRFGTKWLVDFRDPWSEWDVLDQLKLSRRARNSQAKLEKDVLTSADMVLAVSPTLEKSLQDLGAHSTALITNGFDSEVLEAQKAPGSKFRITHIGLLNTIRNPVTLWKVLDDLCQADPGINEDLEVYVGGTIDDAIIRDLSQFEYLKNRFINAGYLSHSEVIEAYADSSVLLLLINNTGNIKINIPGKLFEYLGLGKPVIALGREESDASFILKEAGYDGCLTYEDENAIKDKVLEYYNSFKKGEVFEKSPMVERFHRKELTMGLAGLLDNLTSHE